MSNNEKAIDLLILYRAVGQVERDATLARQSMQWHRNREKCFSPNISWIISNIMGGSFNNSQYDPGRYAYLLEYTLTPDSVQAFRVCRNEWKTNIRQGNKFKVIKVVQKTLDTQRT